MRRLAAAAACGAALARPPALGAQDACPRGALPAYAHNDYRNGRPLADALALGFRGVEADLLLVGGALRVGHDRREAGRGPTFEALYLAPLADVVARCGRLTADAAPFLLTVELKEASRPAYDSLAALLTRYAPRLALASDPGGPGLGGPGPAVEAVLVGWHPPPAELGAAPLAVQHRLTRAEGGGAAGLDPRVRLLSVDYGKTMGRWWVTAAGRRRWLATLRAAKAAAPGRRLRAHNVPADARVYAALRDAGVDLIGATRLAAAARLLGAP